MKFTGTSPYDNDYNVYEDDEDYEYEHLESIEKILEEEDDEKPERTPSKYKLITRRIDCNRIRHKNAKSLDVHTSICKNVKIDTAINSRSGAILYTHQEGKTYFCMGIDSKYEDLTDFAGGVKKEEGVIEGGLRELDEESQGVFGTFTPKDVENCLTFYTSNMMIMFIKVNVDLEKVVEEFQKRVDKKEKSLIESDDDIEVSDIIWLEKTEFLESISGRGRRVYSRVRKILSKVTDIISAL